MRAGDRERYRALVERSADVIFMLDEHGVITYANETAERRVGTPVRSLLGRNALDLVHPDDRTRAIEAMHRSLAAEPGPQEPFFVRVQHADGRWLAVELVGNNLTDDEHVRGNVITMRDISDRDRVDRLLAETEANYRRIVETAEEGIWNFDARITTTFVNRRMSEMLGTTPQEMIGRSVFEFMDDEAKVVAKEILAKGADHPVAQRNELRFIHRDGHDVWTRCSASPIFGIDGAFEGVVNLVTDITEQRAIEEQLRYNEARLTTLFEVSSDIMAILEPGGHWHASPAGHADPRLPDRVGSRRRHPLAGPPRRHRARRAGARGGAERYPGKARADPGAPPPHRRPLPLVRLHRGEPDRQPDRPRHHHHRPRRDGTEGRRRRAGGSGDPVPCDVRAFAARHRAHHLRRSHHRRERRVRRDGRTHRGRAHRGQPRAPDPSRRPGAHARGRCRPAPGWFRHASGAGADDPRRRARRLGDERRLARDDARRRTRLHDRAGGRHLRAQEARGATRVPGVPRPAHPAGQPGPPARPDGSRLAAANRTRPPRAAVRGPRPVQAGERHARPRGR